MRSKLCLLVALASLASAVAQQNVSRVLPTVTELLLIPPARLASTTVGESTNWLSWVETTGDIVPGTGARTWRWDGASTAATNGLPFGTNTTLYLAHPYGASAGRWVWVHTLGAGGGSGEFPALTPNRAVVSDGSGGIAAATVTATEIGRLTGVSDNLTTLLAGKQPTITGSATTIDTETLPAGRAVITDGSGGIAASSITATEIGRLTGISDNLTTLLAGKQPTITGSATTIDTETLPAGRAVITDGSGGIAASSITATEIGRLTGVSDNLTTLLAAKQGAITGAASSITSANLTAGRVMVTDGSGKAAVSSVAASALLDIGGTNAAPDLPWLSVIEEGAWPGDNTDDTAAFLRTATNAVARGKQVLFPAVLTNAVSRYLINTNTIVSHLKGLDIKIPPRVELAPLTYPTGNFSSQDRANSLITLGDNSRVSGGGTVHGRAGEGGFNQYPANIFTIFKVKDATNVVFEDINFRRCYDYPVFGWYSTNVVVARCNWFDCMQGYGFYDSYRPIIVDDSHYGLIMTNEVGGAYCTQQYTRLTKVRGSHFENLISHTRNNTDFAAVYNEFGCVDGSFEKMTFTGINAATAHSAIAFLLDGGLNNLFQGNHILAWGKQFATGLQLEGEVDPQVLGNVIEAERPTRGSVNVGTVGIYSTEWRIGSRSRRDVVGYPWRDQGQQNRGRSLTTGGRIQGNRIAGFHTGVGGSFSDTLVEDNTISDTSFAAIRIYSTLSYGYGVGNWPIQHRIWGNIVRGNTIRDNIAHGLVLSAGDMTEVVGNTFRDNNQGGSSADITTHWRYSGTTGSVSGQTNFVHGLAGQTVNNLLGYIMYWPAKGVGGLIVTNDATTLTISGPTSITITNGEPFVVNYGNVGRTRIHGNYFINTAEVWGITNAASLDPSQNISVANTPFHFTSEEAHMLRPGHQVRLVGVLTGGANLNAIVRNVDDVQPDRVWAVAVNPTTGTFETGTNGLAIWPGTGLVTYVDNPSSYESTGRLTVTGNGTQFGREIDGNYSIRIGSGPWNLVTIPQNDTNLLVEIPYPSNLVSQPFVYSKFSMVMPQTTGPPIRWQNTPGTLDLGRNWVVGKNNGSSTYGPGVDVAGAVNYVWTLRSNSGALNSPYPRIAFGQYNVTANTSATSITNFNGHMDGVEPTRVTATDSNTTLNFTDANSSLQGYTNNITLAVGDSWEMWYSQAAAKWNVKVYQ